MVGVVYDIGGILCMMLGPRVCTHLQWASCQIRKIAGAHALGVPQERFPRHRR